MVVDINTSVLTWASLAGKAFFEMIKPFEKLLVPLVRIY
jgi:hypothetical protein